MKYVVVLGDGMADYPVPQLGGKTPLELAKKPNIDFLARYGQAGMVKTVPDGITPGSDVANLSVMGYDPAKYYTGRSPLEAVSMGVDLAPDDVAFRCNLVTLSEQDDYSEKIMIDYSSDEIPSDQAAEIIEYINKKLGSHDIAFYPGISYRHCMVWNRGPVGLDLTPPHDILEKKIADYLPKGHDSHVLLKLMEESSRILKDHPVNKKRISMGLKPANSIWLWGEGKKPAIPKFYDKYQLKGSVVSAVNLLKGIGLCAGMKSVDVEGATGNIHTNFRGKARAAIRELESGQDFVYVHIEAPDECGHRFEIENKVKSIELIDEKVVGPILEGLEQFEDYCIMVLPDHPTPLSLRTHTSDPVPFVIYRKSQPIESGLSGYDENQSKSTGLYISQGYKLMDYFLGKDIGSRKLCEPIMI